MRNFDAQLLRLKAALGVTSDQEIAALLGMTKAAFSDRKKRDSFPEDKVFALAAKRSDLLIDADYIVSGLNAKQRFVAANGREPSTYAELSEWSVRELPNSHNMTHQSFPPSSTGLPPDEQLLLQAYRALSPAKRNDLLADLLTGGKKTTGKGKASQAAVTISGTGHRVAGRDYHE